MQGKRGRVTLRSSDPLAEPRVHAAYLEHPDDMATYLAGIKLALRIAASPSMREFTDGSLRINWDRCPHTRSALPLSRES
jgi:choline dehydrogenase-like flavoprotein